MCCARFLLPVDFEQFLSCDTLDCISSKKTLLEERLLIGDPNAQFTYYILFFPLVDRLICSTKYGFYGYPKDTYLSTTHLQFSADSHSVAGSLSLATRLQTGDHQPVNLTRALEIAIPAWHSITSRHASLFDALYLPSEIDVRPPARLFPSGRRTWWSRSTTFPITSTCFARSFPARNSDRSNAAFSSAVPAELASHRREIAGFGRSARALSGRGVWGHMFS